MLSFFKYQGTGNDFVIIDNRNLSFNTADIERIKLICDRRFGIGADGLMLLQEHPDYDFEMKYYNADGNESSMCGNGGRCMMAFASKLGVVKNEANFLAVDGPHYAKISDKIVSLQMKDVNKVDKIGNAYVLDTGSPHFVKIVSDLKSIDMYSEGKAIRNSEPFKNKGINVNFVEPTIDGFFVRTYERGVENETFSCGTGVTAVALAMAIEYGLTAQQLCKINTPGGNLFVNYNRESSTIFTEIFLNGPAEFVFEGKFLN